jgi:predicted GNAT family N-acyltransferase
MLSFVRLSHDHLLSEFDCGDADLNDFLINDSKSHLTELMSVTYLITENNKVVAFFSVLNDKISLEDFESEKEWKKKIFYRMPHKFKSYPAVKLGRLGVAKNYQKGGCGTSIVNYMKQLFVTNNRTGCRFITVDAYIKSVKFYEKNDFAYLTEKDKNSTITRLMYFDLTKIM